MLRLAAQSMFDHLAEAAAGMMLLDREHRIVWISDGYKRFLPALGHAEEDFVGRRVEEIKLPAGTRIGAIVRGEGRRSEVLMPHHDTLIEPDDHIIIFIPNKRQVREVEKLFQVSATFFG